MNMATVPIVEGVLAYAHKQARYRCALHDNLIMHDANLCALSIGADSEILSLDIAANYTVTTASESRIIEVPPPAYVADVDAPEPDPEPVSISKSNSDVLPRSAHLLDDTPYPWLNCPTHGVLLPFRDWTLVSGPIPLLTCTPLINN